MKILAIKWRQLGDTVLWTSALEALRLHYPKAEIHLALPKAYVPLFSGDSRFHRLLPLTRGWAVLGMAGAEVGLGPAVLDLAEVGIPGWAVVGADACRARRGLALA